jgi:hypothetical protein
MIGGQGRLFGRVVISFIAFLLNLALCDGAEGRSDPGQIPHYRKTFSALAQYKPVAMILRAVLRDPLMMQAHLRPRVAGRPRSKAS